MKFSSIVSHPVLTLLSRLVVGGVFVWYGMEKIVLAKDFAHNIMNYEMLPHQWVNIMALIMPWIEVICGLMLILGIRLRAASMLTALMIVSFLMAISYALANNLQIDCGCSAHPEPIGPQKLVEDGAYLLLCLQIFFFPSQMLSLESYIRKNDNTSEAMVAEQPLVTE